ncbi:MAG TPA: DNA-3-methyladenine glycosylase [Gammaproteobacteria bacterium]|nr:DNA-3-methyladenine glycosylase [Gammaproteobacteria bacterium]
MTERHAAPAPARPLPRDFYARGAVAVARALLGKLLVREYRGERLSGIISEVEGYLGERDSASHAFRGPTPRNAVMFGEGGHIYVYFVYGMHHCMNVVAGREGRAAAVLLRGIRPLEGIATMRRLRMGREPLADGPGKLCQALAIDRSLDGHDLTRGEKLWIESRPAPSRSAIGASPRIGIAYALPEHRDAKWRFFLREGRCVCGGVEPLRPLARAVMVTTAGFANPGATPRRRREDGGQGRN